MKHGQTYFEGKGVGLVVRLVKKEILDEMVWILLNEIASKSGLEESVCTLECLSDQASCDHGTYDPHPLYHNHSLEDAQDARKSGYKRAKRRSQRQICDLKYSCHQKTSPFSSLRPSTADELGTANLISVIATKRVTDTSQLKYHPAMLSGSDKFYQTILPVRQYMSRYDRIHGKQHLLLQYIEDVELLEANSLLITGGEWREPMTRVFEKQAS